MDAIKDYAIIGDCRSAALVSRSGSIDWLCWPRFDSASLFGAILDDDAGHWRIAPCRPCRIARSYIDGSNVLETRYHTATGTVTLTDFMTVASEEEKRRTLFPDHEILRIARCDAGEVELEMELVPKPCYATGRARIRDAGAQGLRIETDHGLVLLRTAMPTLVSDGRIRARVKMRAGEMLDASLTLSTESIAVLPLLGARSLEACARSVGWWRTWLSALTYDGPARDAVTRSALALRLLVYAPSGAMVAAPTTSLPERIGGDLNWDYRFCWLRDAALTTRALFGLGFLEEGEAFVAWLLHSTQLTRPRLRILYDVHGGIAAPERILPHLRGHRDSRPVRVGNDARDQLQLDVYGEVIDATTRFVRKGGRIDRDTAGMLCDLGAFVCAHWDEPDEGIWEPRSGRRHHTHSRLLCWTALDRLIELGKKGHLGCSPLEAFVHHRALIRRQIETRAWNERLKSYVAVLDSDELDASLLRMPWYGFIDARSERMRSTHAKIERALGGHDGLLFRYGAGESPGEGAFGICSFWNAEYLALSEADLQVAEDMFERLCSYGNDVGLFAEEIDPRTGDALGNFPQAFTHVGLVNAALTIARLQAGQKPLGQRVPPRAETEQSQAREPVQKVGT
jgi:GH15 family glucan-1,4-alpha-glucosidase